MFRKAKAALAFSLAAVMMASTLTACKSGSASSSGSSSSSSTPSSSSAAPKDITLTLWGSQDDQAMLKTMADNFTKTHTDNNYTIKLGVCGEDVAATTVLKDVDAAGDVFAFASDQLATLQTAGALLPITIDTDKIKSDNTAASVTAATVDSQLYAYPSSADTYFLYYDKKYLKDSDVTSLENIMSKQLPSGVKNFAMNLNNNGWYVASFFLAAGCKVFGQSGTDPTQCDFNSANGLAGATYMLSLVSQKSKFVDWGANFDSLLAQNFKNRTIAAAVSGTWNAAKIQQALGSDFGATKLPTIKLSGKDTQMGSFANFKLYGVNAHSKNPAAAMALAEFLTNQDNQKIRFEQRSFAPTNTALSSDSSALASNVAVAADALQNKYATLQPSIKQMSNFWTPVGSLGTTMENGKTTSATLQKDLDNMVKSVLAKLS